MIGCADIQVCGNTKIGLYSLKEKSYIYLFIYLCGGRRANMFQHTRKSEDHFQESGLSVHLWFQGWSSDCQAWQQALSPTQSSPQPQNYSVLFLVLFVLRGRCRGRLPAPTWCFTTLSNSTSRDVAPSSGRYRHCMMSCVCMHAGKLFIVIYK